MRPWAEAETALPTLFTVGVRSVGVCGEPTTPDTGEPGCCFPVGPGEWPFPPGRLRRAGLASRASGGCWPVAVRMGCRAQFPRASQTPVCQPPQGECPQGKPGHTRCPWGAAKGVNAARLWGTSCSRGSCGCSSPSSPQKEMHWGPLPEQPAMPWSTSPLGCPTRGLLEKRGLESCWTHRTVLLPFVFKKNLTMEI